MKRFKITVLYFEVLFFLMLSLTVDYSLSKDNYGLKFKISFPSSIHTENITGRVYVIISTNDSREPRFQTGYTGVPFWGKNVYALKPGKEAVIDGKVFGFPLKSIKDIPTGEYFVEGFINIYTKFKRSDGHTIWLHNYQWEGQQWKRSPGNLYSNVIKVKIDA